jgi:hypothetical protein
VFIKENPIHSFIFFPKFRKDDLCNKDLSTKTSEWVDFFEEPNSRGITVDHIEICRGEISGI